MRNTIYSGIYSYLLEIPESSEDLSEILFHKILHQNVSVTAKLMSLINRISGTDFVAIIQAKITSLLKQKSNITIAVPGGATPKLYFKALSDTEIEWSRVNIFLTDERWVNTDSDMSNEKLIRNHLLQNKAEQAIFHGVYREGLSIQEGIVNYNQQFKMFCDTFDLVLLGMGNDCHIASVFPGDKGIYEIQGDYAYELSLGSSSIPRVSLTPTAITQTLLVILVISGQDKEDAISTAWKTEDVIKYPVLTLKYRQPASSFIYSLV